MARFPWVRTGAAAAAACLSLAGAAPALADDGGTPVIPILLPTSPVVGSSGITALDFSAPYSGGAPLQNLVITVDLTKIAGFAGVSDISKNGVCAHDVCTFSWSAVGAPGATGGVDLVGRAGAQPGATGQVTVSGTASNASFTGATTTVTYGAPHLYTDGLTGRRNVSLGTADFPVGFANSGEVAAPGVQLTVMTTDGLRLKDYSDCVYSTPTEVDWKAKHFTHEAVCSIPGPLDAGAYYRLASPMTVEVGDNALFEDIEYFVSPLAGAPSGAGGADALTLVPGPSFSKPLLPAEQFVNADNTADFAVTGNTVSAKAGDTVPVRMTVTDHGPAQWENLESDVNMGALIVPPAGTTAVSLPPHCAPWDTKKQDDWQPPKDDPKQQPPAYLCELSNPYTPDETTTLPFALKIGPGAPATATGSVGTQLWYNDARPWDKDSSNDTAPLVVHVTGGATTPPSTGGATGGGSTGGTSGSGGGSGGTSGGTSGGGSAGSGGSGSGGGGGLADTGFGGGELIGFAVALIAAGAGAFGITRRIRARGGRA